MEANRTGSLFRSGADAVRAAAPSTSRRLGSDRWVICFPLVNQILVQSMVTHVPEDVQHPSG
jgi:hypothetical protein